jgi:hypothetical protein
MPDEVRIWQVEKNDKLTEIDRSTLDLEERIEKWIMSDISVLSPDLLIIGEQVATAFGKYIDLLCINSSGDLVIVELKRDKTPRDVTAQTLDYASWIKDLSVEEIEAIASKHFNGTTLEAAFLSRFETDLPEVINEHHRMLVVASEIDGSTERIIRYLSETYGVDINAVRFQFYQAQDGREFLVRTFTVAPDEVEQNAKKSKGKRTVPTVEEMEQEAEKSGVGELFRCSKQTMAPYFRVTNRKTACAFHGRLPDGSSKVVFSLVPAQSSADGGLRYQLYSKRLAEYLGEAEDAILQHLPVGAEHYEYYPDAPPDLKGWAGYFKASSEIATIKTLFDKKALTGG